MKAYLGEDSAESKIPDDLLDAAESARFELIEHAAEGDDELLMKYLDEEELTVEELRRGFKAAMMAGNVAPLVYAAPQPGIGIKPVLEALVALFPTPEEPGPFQATDASGSEIEILRYQISHLWPPLFSKPEKTNMGKPAT